MIGSWSVTLGQKVCLGLKKRNFLFYSTFQFQYSLSILGCRLAAKVELYCQNFTVSLAQSGWVQSKSCTANKTQPSTTIFNRKSNNPATPVIAAARDNNHRRLIWLLEFRQAHTAAVSHSAMSHNG